MPPATPDIRVTLQQVATLKPGDRVRVTQRIVGHNQTWLAPAEGTVISCQPETTGSWFAQAKNGKLWLIRIRLRKEDGELTAIAVDQNSRIERL